MAEPRETLPEFADRLGMEGCQHMERRGCPEGSLKAVVPLLSGMVSAALVVGLPVAVACILAVWLVSLMAPV